jgi:hypothetical protein
VSHSHSSTPDDRIDLVNRSDLDIWLTYRAFERRRTERQGLGATPGRDPGNRWTAERRGRRGERRGESRDMLRSVLGISETDLERELLRNAVGALAAGRTHCADCGRTPLTGERVHRYSSREVVCELCRPAHGGAPERSELVRSSERGQTVRLRAA